MKFVVYYRVSTKKQGESGLGLEAQQRDIELYFERYADVPFTILGEFTDIESGSKSDRVEYQKAIQLAQKNKATLIVAKLDRIGRDVEEIAGLIKRVDLKVAQMPFADRFQLHLYAAMAEQEREFISQRTKAALKAAKARGVKLGGNRGNIDKANEAASNKAKKDAEQYRSQIELIRSSGIESFKGIADKLNELGVKTVRGGEFKAEQVKRLISKLEG